jgi:hypothetical protein
MDPEPRLIFNYLIEIYKEGKIDNDTILNYIPEDSIIRDLEQNRIWAKLYYDAAVSVLGIKNVICETIYVTEELKKTEYTEIHRKIANFLNKFTN